MIHDYATAPRQTNWHSNRSAELKSNVKTGVKIKPVVLLFLAACVVLFVVQQLILKADPVLDQQPDKAAKTEYAESILYSENAAGEQSSSLYSAETVPFNSSESQQTVALESAKPSTTKQPSSDKSVADKRGNELDPDYDFYDSLRKDSWPVLVNKGTYVDGQLTKRERPVYKLQAASFRSKSDAYRLLATLKRRQLQAIVVESVSTSGEFWYQVSVGPFENTSKLNKAQDILVSLGMMPLKKRVK